jgi:transcriptional regulator with XRE-family HTH domain
MHHTMPSSTPNDPRTAGILAASRAREIGIDQQQIADSLGISQSQVSRIFGGRIRRHTDTLMRVCKYVADQSLSVSAEEVRQNTTLIDAIADVWDGTERDAQLLASVIRSLGALRKSDHR